MPDESTVQQEIAERTRQVAQLYQEGRYREALELAAQVCELARQHLGETHPDSATSLSNLAALYDDTGDYQRAESLFRQALEIRRQALGKGHPDYAASLNNLAGLYYAKGDFARAEPLSRQASDICRQVLGDSHPDYAASLSSQVALYSAAGDYARAEPLCRQASDILLRVVGESHPDYAQSLNNLAMLYVAQGRALEAFDLMCRVPAIDERILGQVFTIGSDSQRLAYLRSIQVNLDCFLSLVSRHLADSRPAIQAALEVVLRRKALGAEASLALRGAILSGRYPHLQSQLRLLALLRGVIARKSLDGPCEGEDPAALVQLQSDSERLEQALSRQIPEMKLEEQIQKANRRAIALHLDEGIALVEFVRFDVFNFHAVPARGERWWQPAHYLAFVLPAGEPDNVQMIDLGEAEPIDRLIADFRAGITGDAEQRRGMKVVAQPSADATADTPALDEGSQLREKVFEPLRRVLRGRTRLLLAPDGELTRLPFEVLPGDANGGRLIDSYQISYVSTGRDVLRFGAATSGQATDPLVVGDPDFDLSASTPAATASSPTTAPLPVGRCSRDLDRGRRCERLPGTRVEAVRIARALGVEPWLDAKVLEGGLKQVRSPRLLHLSTHGFFLHNQEADPNQEARDLATGSFDRLAGLRLENPLLRSGLILAGSNTWQTGGQLPPEAEDCMLTAEDVTGLDLLATELVVLSACETGVGEIHVGEGVFGLRRAFVVAGARTLVMSLWKVPDQQTQELMIDFYRRLLTGVPRADALRQAQLQLKSRYPDPYFWGAFICQGEPSPLSPATLAAVRPSTSRSRTMSEDLSDELERLQQQVEQLAQQSQFEQALPLARQACDLARDRLGATHPAVLPALTRLAELCEAAGDYAAAEALYLQLLELLNASLEEIHPGIVQTLGSLTRVRKVLTKPAAAESASRSVTVAPARPPAVTAPAAGAQESGPEAGRVSRHATVRYYRQMTPQRVYPLLVVLSKEKLQQLAVATVAQATSPELTLAQGSSVLVEPILPGCTCYPPRAVVSVAADRAEAKFYVVGEVDGQVTGARVLLAQGGHILAEVPLAMHVGKHTVAQCLAVLALVLPWLLRATGKNVGASL
jgi:CHAT domain-containing protein